MNNFSLHSLEQLVTCHADLQRVMNEAIKHIDFLVTEGHRGEAAQEKDFMLGLTKVHWPDGKHNELPSNAVDIAPYPLDWDNWKGFFYQAGFIMGIASQMGIKLRWGGDWNMNGIFTDEHFYDLGHFELITNKGGQNVA